IVLAVPLFLPLQLPRASESPVTFHCIGRSSLPPSRLPRASEPPVTFRRVHTPQALSSHTIRIREESYRFFTIDLKSVWLSASHFVVENIIRRSCSYRPLVTALHMTRSPRLGSG